MSRISSTFGRNVGWKHSSDSAQKKLGGVYLTDVPTKSKMPPSHSKSSLRRSGSYGSLRKSSGNMSANFTDTGSSGGMNGTLERIESEYIKNLQQQVYFLELEANYLREQAQKATEMHPVMTTEAENMLQKLRYMQGEFDSAQLELKRNEASVEILATEKERVLAKMKAEEDSYQREKRLLLDENVQMRKQKEIIERESNRKDSQIMQANAEVDKVSSTLRTAETNLQITQNQLKQKAEQLKLSELALQEKRSELMQAETKLGQMEEKYYSSNATIADKINQDLREEIRSLREKLKETEFSADHDRFLRTKITDDSSHLIKENALLNQQILELKRQVERERDTRESQDTRTSQNISDMVLAKDGEKALQYELQQLHQQLVLEQQRNKEYMINLTQQDQTTASQELSLKTTKSRLAEIEAQYKVIDSENTELRRDKMLLVDHIADLQQKCNHADQELAQLRISNRGLHSRTQDLEHLKTIESSLHSQKWDEFSRLADSMKSLSRAMAQNSSPRTTTTTKKKQVLEYA